MYSFDANGNQLSLVQGPESFSNNVKAFSYHPSTTYIYVLVENEGLYALSTDFATKTIIERTENLENVIKLEISERSGDALLVAACNDGYLMYYVQVSRIGINNYQAMVLKSNHNIPNVVATPSSEYEPCSTFFLVRNDGKSTIIDLVKSYDGLDMEGECLLGSHRIEFLIETKDSSYNYITNITGVCDENDVECLDLNGGMSRNFSVLAVLLMVFVFFFKI